MQEATEKIGEASKRSARSHQIRCEKELKEARESSEIEVISNSARYEKQLKTVRETNARGARNN
jgi:hypothetical protein